MTHCHCRGLLRFITSDTGHTMSQCTRCGAVACTLRITVQQLELIESVPRATILADEVRCERARHIAGRCESLGCTNRPAGRALFCDPCIAERTREARRRSARKTRANDHVLSARRRKAWETRRANQQRNQQRNERQAVAS